MTLVARWRRLLSGLSDAVGPGALEVLMTFMGERRGYGARVRGTELAPARLR